MNGLLLGFASSGTKTVDVTVNSLFGLAASPGTASTEYTSVTQTNLVAPISYNWTLVSGSTSIYVSDAAAKTVRFFGYLSGGDISGVWKCTVTDSVGTVLNTPNVTINFEDIS